MNLEQAKKFVHATGWFGDMQENFKIVITAAKVLLSECDELQQRVDEMSAYNPADNEHLGICGLCGHDHQELTREHVTEMQKLAKLVAEMRHAQVDYFRLRSPSVLAHRRALERRVDDACREILEGDRQAKLFGE